MDLILTTVISCKQLVGIFNRLEKNLHLTPLQKIEVVQELKRYFKTCPIKVK